MAALLVKPPEGKPYKVPLGEGDVTIGRSSSNRVNIPDDPRVSREHCRIVRSGPGWAVMDLGGANGTRLNKEKIAREKRDLFNGDRVMVGGTVIVYEDPSRPRDSLASRIVGSLSGLLGGGKKSEPDNAALLAKGRMRCECGTIINVAGKSPGEKVGCPRCRRIRRVGG